MITDKEENTRRVLRRKKGYRGSASRLKLCKVAPISLHRKSGKVEDVQMLVNWQSEEVVYHASGMLSLHSVSSLELSEGERKCLSSLWMWTPTREVADINSLA